MDLRTRLESRLEKIPIAGCWILMGGKATSKGYGVIYEATSKERWIMTHRAAWEVYRGPIPIGMHVLHKCDITYCINPDHLYLGDQLANSMDAVLRHRYINSGKTHCIRGHPLSQDNIYIWKNKRKCKICHKLRYTRGG